MLNLEKKSATISFGFDEVKGIFIGYASVFNEVDRVNDTIKEGAYDEEIKAWTEGKAIPINYEHEKSITLAENLDSMSVDLKGLLVQWTFSEEAKALYPDIFEWAVNAAKGGYLFMSIGFTVLKSTLGANRKLLKEKFRKHDEISLISLDHIAITDFPVDTKAQVLEVKSTDANFNEMMQSVDGKVTAKRFLKENKSVLSNTNVENFINHVFNLAEKSLQKKFETEKKSLCEEPASVSGSEIDDFDSVLDQVVIKLKK